MLKLEARRRVGIGKGAGRRIRTGGLIPAVMYGSAGEAVSLAVDPKSVKAILASPTAWNTVFSVEVDGGETVPCARFAEIQKHPVRRTLLHCDIQRLDPDVPRVFKVPIRLSGVSPAEKIGSKVRFVTRDTRVRAKPADIPEAVVVDVGALAPGQTIRVSDLGRPETYEILYRDNFPVVSASSLGGTAPGEDDEAASDS